jgi:hypothetical protein
MNLGTKDKSFRFFSIFWVEKNCVHHELAYFSLNAFFISKWVVHVFGIASSNYK